MNLIFHRYLHDNKMQNYVHGEECLRVAPASRGLISASRRNLILQAMPIAHGHPTISQQPPAKPEACPGESGSKPQCPAGDRSRAHCRQARFGSLSLRECLSGGRAGERGRLFLNSCVSPCQKAPPLPAVPFDHTQAAHSRNRQTPRVLRQSRRASHWTKIPSPSRGRYVGSFDFQHSTCIWAMNHEVRGLMERK
jgi:hypothetical protein